MLGLPRNYGPQHAFRLTSRLMEQAPETWRLRPGYRYHHRKSTMSKPVKIAPYPAEELTAAIIIWNPCVSTTPRTTVHRHIAPSFVREIILQWHATSPVIGHKPTTSAGGWGLGHRMSSSSSVGGEWYPPGSVIILEFHAVFGLTSVGGVLFSVPPVIKWRSKNVPKVYQRICSCVCCLRELCFLSYYTVFVLIFFRQRRVTHRGQARRIHLILSSSRT